MPQGYRNDYEDYDLVQLHREYGSQREVCKHKGWSQGAFSEWLAQREELHKACKEAAIEHRKEMKERRLSGPPVAEIVGVGPGVELNVQAVRQAAELRFEGKARRAEQKQHQRINFPHGPIALFFVGDQHIGNAGTDVSRMFREQELIMDIPGAFVWQMGDLIDNFVVGKLIAENFKESLPIFEQWELARYYLQGFEDRLVAYTSGNHEAWTAMLSGIDYRRDICPEGVLYDGDDIRAFIDVGPHTFSAWARHKWRGSSMYNPTHQLERAARFDSARFDLYIGAHLHTGSVYREFILDGQRKAAIQTGSYKEHDDYARKQGFPGHDSSTACALVLHDTGSFFGCSDIEAVKTYMESVYQG